MPLDAATVLEERGAVFINRGCLFVSTTGKLLTGYVNCEIIFPHFDIMWDLSDELIIPFLDEVEGFICPSTGDIALVEYCTIHANLAGRNTVAVWADKVAKDTYRAERRGYEESIRGKKVVVIMDRISNGGTTMKIIQEAQRCGAIVIGVAALSAITAANEAMFGVPKVHALSRLDVQNFALDEVPTEYRRMPICIDEPLGHGRSFKEDNPGQWRAGYVLLLEGDGPLYVD